jgi:hypothetical protein
MRAGTESRWKVILMVVLALVAIGSFVNMLAGFSSSPQTARASSTKTDTAYEQLFGKQQARRNTRRGPVVAQQSPDPTVRLDLLKVAEDTRYEGSNRNIFEPQAREIEKPVETGIKPGPINPPPEQVVQKPQIPLKFFGFASRPDEPKKVFLSQGEDVFIAGEGDIVNRRYRVVRINNNAVEVEDMLNNHQQSLPLLES